MNQQFYKRDISVRLYICNFFLSLTLVHSLWLGCQTLKAITESSFLFRAALTWCKPHEIMFSCNHGHCHVNLVQSQV